MKDDEIYKLIYDAKIDNIKQERELFKHIAILSSAIVGVFAFNDKVSIGILSKIGIGGLFLVIILSIFLIYIILQYERKALEKSCQFILSVKNIREDFIRNSVGQLINKESLVHVKNIFNGDIDESDIEKINEALSLLINNTLKGDEKIDEQKELIKLETEKKLASNIIHYMALFTITLFILSLGMILWDTVL